MIDDYLMAASFEQALRTLLEAPAPAVFLAGGTEVNRLGSLVQARTVVSLKQAGCNRIESADGIVSIGSCTTLQALVDNPSVPQWVRDSALFCASRTRRNMATIGGNAALCRDDSYLMPALVAAKARFVVADITTDGLYVEENVPAREYLAFHDHFSKALIVSVVLNKPGRFVASRRFARTAQSPAALTVSLGADMSSGKMHDVRICAAVKGSGVVRLPLVEDLVATGGVSEDLVLRTIDDSVSCVDDITGSGAYKRYLLATAVMDLCGACTASVQGGAR